MKPIIIILLLAIAGIAYLNNAPAIHGTAVAPTEVPSLDNASSDDILAAAFDSPDSNSDSSDSNSDYPDSNSDSQLDNNSDEIIITVRV